MSEGHVMVMVMFLGCVAVVDLVLLILLSHVVSHGIGLEFDLCMLI